MSTLESTKLSITPVSKDNVSKETYEELRERFSKETNNIAIQLVTNPNNDFKTTANNLHNLMSEKVDEFEKKTGNKMTYGEMRSMWG